MFKKKLFILILFMGLVSFQFKLSSQTIQTFATPGVTSWTCPVGVTSVTVECWGAGGGGGGASTANNAVAGGGGGGAYASSFITVTAGNVYTITVGAAGAGGANTGTAGASGANSSFNSTIVMAVGGSGGGGATTATPGAGGTGGLLTSCIGTIRYSGGNGAAGSAAGGGGGGSSAGTFTNGNNASTYIGGTAPAGGGSGATSNTISTGAAGLIGLSPGGAGSGGKRGIGINYGGGAGGDGKVVLSYCTAMSITSTQTNVSCTGGNDGIIDLAVTGGIQNNNNIILDVQTVDDICSTGDIDSWQSFTPTFTARLAAFEVKLDGPDNGNWYLYKGTGVGGVLLASGTYAAAASGYKYISIPSLPQLTAGQICTFRLTNFSADWLVTCSANYSGGQDNNNNTLDRVFKTHMVLNPYSYLWSNGALTEDVSNLLAGAYTVTVTDAVGCSAVDTKTITSLGPLAITASASPTTICAGSTSTLTAFGPLTLDQYSIPGSQTGSWAGTNAEQQTFIPSMTGLLRKIRIQTYAPFAGTSVTINIKSGTPTTGTLLTSVTYFKGGPINSWDDIILPGSGINVVSGTTYYIEIVSGSQVDWIYNLTNTYANGNASRGGTNFGWDYNFETYMDLNTYVWNPGALSNPEIIVSPTITTNHTVTVTNTLSCTNSQMVTVNVAPTSVGGTASANQSICIGQVPSPITLTGFTGAIQWQSSPDNSNWINITGATTNALTSAQMGALSATTYYRANVTSGLCTAALSNTIVITVNPFPNIIASSSSTAICVGFTASLTATGAVNYTWNPGSLTGTLTSGVSNLNVSPSVTTVYTVTGTSATGCTNTQTVSLTVNNNPTVTATSSPTAICVGASANLTAAGASTYTWNPGPLTGSLVSVSPNATTIYTLTGASSEGCVKTQTVNLTVNPNLPLSISISSSSTTICSGTSVNFFSTQANAGSSPTYQWQLNGSNIPGATFATYGTSTLNNNDIVSLIVTSSEVCAVNSPAFSNSITMTVNPNLPLSISISSSSTTICSGTSVNFFSTQANAGSSPTYQWQLNGSNIPGATFATYGTSTLNNNDIVSLIVTSSEVCAVNSPAFSNSITMTVNPNLPLSTSISSSSTTICSGTSVNFLSTEINSGTSPTYQWQLNGSNIAGATFPTFSSNTLNDYDVISLIMTANEFCTTNSPAYSNSITLTVNPNPILSVTASSTTICEGSVSTLSASGANTYTWTPGLISGSIITVTPTINTTYTVTGDNGTGCIGSETISIIVNSLPIANAVLPSSDTICYDGAVAVGLNSQAGITSFSWTSSYGVSNNAQFPTFTNVTSVGNVYFYGSVEDGNGCISLYDTVLVVVTPSITLSALTADVSCFGLTDGLIDLSAAGGFAPYSYSWSNSSFTEDLSSLPAGNYSVTVNDASTCTTSLSVIITEPTSLVANSVESSFIGCNGGNGILTVSATGGTGTYIGTGSYTVVAGNYTYTVTDANGCSSTTTININEPTQIVANVNITSPITCNGGNAFLTVSATGGAGTYIGTGTYTVAAGNYTYTVTDSNGCSSTATISVTEPTAIVANVNITAPIACNGGNAILTVSATGGTGAYTGAGTFTVAAGNYTYTVTDANGCSNNATITVTQPSPVLLIASATNSIICIGQSSNLNVTGAQTYTWSPGLLLGASVTVNPVLNTTYTVTGDNGSGCVGSETISIIVNSLPVVNAGANQTICNSQPVTLTGSGSATSYTWNNGAINGTAFTPTISNSYIVTGTDLNNCSNTDTMDVTVNSILTLTLSASTSSICSGATATLTANGASTYTWNPGLLSGSTVSVNPTSTTVYTATGTSSLGCLDTKTINLIVNSNPTITATSSSSAICSGGSATLTGSGAISYTWNPGSITSLTTVVSPSVTTNYTLIGTNAAGCSSSQTLNLTVNSNPTVSIVSSPSVICVGETSTLTASGANTYSWNTGATSSSISVSPTATNVYIVTGTNVAGCVKSQTVNLAVNPLPTLTVSATSMSICNGSSVTLTASGASTYTWNPGVLTGSVVSVSPSSSTVYSVIGTNANGCVNSETISVTVNSNPTINAVASSSAICSGETATLSATGASTYSWSSGSINATEIVTPVSSSVYTVVGTDAIGCVNSATLNLVVNALPIISINSSSAAICAQSSATLMASGANTYTWSTNETASIIEVAPSASLVYTVTGTDALGCVNTETLNLIVNPLPSLSLTASPSSICVGATSTLSASGANTYSWNTGSSLSSIFESPVITTIYTVIGTDILGCVNSETVSLTVNALPSLTVSASSNAVCVGNSATLTVTGANTYSWSSGGTSSSEVVSPSATTIYTVVGIDAIGCSNSDTVRVFANSLPNILTNVNTNTVCLGGVVVFSNLGANTFTLMPSALTGSLINVPMNNVGLTVYTVTGTGPLGCTNTKTVSITTFDIPAVSISPSSSTICAGQSVVLNASGASTYTWSGSGTVSGSITDAPLANTSYSVIGTDINGCSNSSTATVNVSNTPTVSISSPSTSVCMGYTMSVSATGATSYSWSTGATTNSINVQPFTNTTFSVVGSNGGTCTDTAFLSLTVLPLPSVTASASNTLVCSGQQVNLTASGTATTYVWTPGTLIGANQTVQVTAPVTYTVYGQGANGCAFLSTVLIDTKSGTTVTPIASPSLICIGDSATLSVIGGSVPSWSNNIVPTLNIVAPLSSTTYTYDAIDVNGCASVVEFNVDIDPDCNVIIYNGFTPNGDGLNDFWIIDNIEKFPNNKVYIFNRWGNKIFQTTEYNNTNNVWDGKLNGQLVPSGTYFYVIESELLIKKGWIEITN